ncbi:MAG TPA: glycosyltransferase [Chthoniobacterales bacterium]|nr:glycosyltransferase [Chthoniobacterales bacterium]
MNWFSPLPPAKTDVAGFTARIAPALAEQFDVTFWTDAASWERDLERFGKIRRYRSSQTVDADPADSNVFNLGNDPRFHKQIYHLCRRWPGIVVLHDLDLGGLLRSVSRQDRQLRRALRQRSKDRHLRPDLKLVLENAQGVIVHTREAYNALHSDESSPVIFRSLPFPASELKQSRQTDSRLPKRLVMFGFFGANRRLESVLRALGTYPNKNQFRLDVFGEIKKPRELERTIRKFSLRDLVKVHGFVSEEELDDALAQTDLAINLRYPTMGEASGSQLRIWNQAVPSLVTRIGWYADLPLDTVAYVDTENEIFDLHAHFDGLRHNPEQYRQIGQRGRAALIAGHSPESYVKAIAELAGDASVIPNTDRAAFSGATSGH